jgi:hypothetical protein
MYQGIKSISVPMGAVASPRFRIGTPCSYKTTREPFRMSKLSNKQVKSQVHQMRMCVDLFDALTVSLPSIFSWKRATDNNYMLFQRFFRSHVVFYFKRSFTRHHRTYFHPLLVLRLTAALRCMACNMKHRVKESLRIIFIFALTKDSKNNPWAAPVQNTIRGIHSHRSRHQHHQRWSSRLKIAPRVFGVPMVNST